MTDDKSNPLAYDLQKPVPPAPRSSTQAGIVLLAIVAALFVIGFIAFSGPTDEPAVVVGK